MEELFGEAPAGRSTIGGHLSEVHPNTCKICGGPIQIIVRRMTGICSELCEKIERGE
jgi:hypothetical protein